MGEFAHTSAFAPPSWEYSKPRTHGHTHGSVAPYHIRCGINEGLCVLNTQAHVAELFTDSLIGCAQVIFRNPTATFTCHIGSGARTPTDWARWAADRFVHFYGAIVICHVITGDAPGIGNAVEVSLIAHLGGVQRLLDLHGCSINIATGNVRTTPVGWSATRPNVAGWQTARDLLDLRLLGTMSLGEPGYGDYCELCPACAD
jgi:hypothetical protein